MCYGILLLRCANDSDILDVDQINENSDSEILFLIHLFCKCRTNGHARVSRYKIASVSLCLS